MDYLSPSWYGIDQHGPKTEPSKTPDEPGPEAGNDALSGLVRHDRYPGEPEALETLWEQEAEATAVLNEIHSRIREHEGGHAYDEDRAPFPEGVDE